MNERQAETNFVRGIAWHDIAKPFYLGRDKHSRTGFLLLAAADYQQEATAALCHVGGANLRDNLKLYWRLSQAGRLPAMLLLSNALDRLAASTYSFVQQDFSSPFQSHHNPFTRLPETHSRLGITFQVKEHERTQKIEGPLHDNLINQAPPIWRDSLRKCLSVGGNTGAALVWPEKLQPVTGEDGQTLDPVELFYEYNRAYPERTYPPVNDTVLSEHTRLSAIFAWVVYRNLAKAKHEILQWEITPADEGAQLPDGSDAVDFVSPQRDSGLGFSPGQELVRDHLEGYLARITFSGHQQWVEEAARLDDLNGAQVLTERMRSAFKYALAARLDVPQLAEFLWVSESAFDLVYLLPKALGEVDDLEKFIQESYEEAVDWLISGEGNPDNLKRVLEDDFRQANPPLGITDEPGMIALKNQLTTLGYTLWMGQVELPTDETSYGAFTAAYGAKLLGAYKDSLEQGGTLMGWRSALTILAASEQEDMEDICTICGTHPVYKQLADLLPDNVFLRKVTHTFRGEAERPCLSCIARRVLAHKQVQVEALHRMIKYDAETGTIRVEPDADSKLGVPSGLLHTDRLESKDDFLDMGAAYVRLARKPKPGHQLDIFPTISYAADSMGNVAMLTLSVTKAVFEEYKYRPALERVKQENSTDTERALPSWDAFIKDYAAFCDKVAEQKPELLNQVEIVKQHLARVLARQTKIGTFYTVVAEKLEEAGIRALALNVDYPTGRWLLPAMDLPRALKALGTIVAADLLAVPRGDLDTQTRCLLSLLTPPLLDGTVLVFKQKFPIYLVLEAERTLRTELAIQQPISGKTWYGMHLALADMRGTLTSRAPGLVAVTLDALPDLLELNKQVDRRTIMGRAADLGRGEQGDKWAQDIADARLFIRSVWWGMEDNQRPEIAQALIQDSAFEPVLFFKHVARE